MQKLDEIIKLWKRYVDHTITYIKSDLIMDVIDIFTKFKENIKFTYEEKQ